MKPENINFTLLPHSKCSALNNVRVRSSCGHWIILKFSLKPWFMFKLFCSVCVSDVYLCAVLICCVGLLCMCMFTVAVGCQYLQKKRHLKGTNLFIYFTSEVNVFEYEMRFFREIRTSHGLKR